MDKPKLDSVLIDSVPGVEHSTDQRRPKPGDVTSRMFFNGDPRRVIGHPSNPTTPLADELARRLDDNTKKNVAEEVGVVATNGLIEVPAAFLREE